MGQRDWGKCLRAHVAKYCGDFPARAFRDEAMGVSVAAFADTPDAGLHTFLTVGVSGHVLSQRVSDRPLRVELLVCVDKKYATLPWQEVLLAVAKGLIESHVPPMRGEVLGPAGPLFPEASWSHATALLCSEPAFYPVEFSEVICDGTTIVFVELIPITSSEADWIRERGWSAFFDRVNRGEVDICDLARE